MTQYLQDTVEAIGIDLVNPGICHFVWKVEKPFYFNPFGQTGLLTLAIK